MRGVTQAAKRANGLSQACGKCRYRFRDPGICELCGKAFIEGFKKGAKWAENKGKEVENNEVQK